MKKKYFTPEMEEIKMDEPIVLEENPASITGEGACTENRGCGPSDV